MLTLITVIITLGIFFKLFGFSLVASWGIAKFFTSAVFVVLCIALIFMTGSIFIVLPIYIVYKFTKKKNKINDKIDVQETI